MSDHEVTWIAQGNHILYRKLKVWGKVIGLYVMKFQFFGASTSLTCYVEVFSAKGGPLRGAWRCAQAWVKQGLDIMNY